MANAQVVSIHPKGINICMLRGDFKNRVYGPLPTRAGLETGSFVDVTVHPSGQYADWAN